MKEKILEKYDFTDNLGHELKNCIEFQEIIKDAEATEKYIEVFQHHHRAYYEKGKLTDYCRECGLDLRDPIHIRQLKDNSK